MSRPFFRPKMFSPGDRVWNNSCTVGAHVLATVVCFTKWATTVQSVLFLYPEILYHSFGPPITSVLMQKSLHLCSVCLHRWRVPRFALKYPCNASPPGGETIPWRPPPPPP